MYVFALCRLLLGGQLARDQSMEQGVRGAGQVCRHRHGSPERVGQGPLEGGLVPHDGRQVQVGRSLTERIDRPVCLDRSIDR